MKKTLTFILAMCLAPSIYAQTWSKDLEKKAKQGDVTAQYEVGVSYLKGSGTDANPKKAAKFLMMATQQGNDDAKSQLLSFFSKELEKLAESGDVDAQFELGNLLYDGKTVEKDTEAASEWYERAMEQGHKAAKKKFYSFESKRRSKIVGTYRVTPWMQFTGRVISHSDGSKQMGDSPCEFIFGRWTSSWQVKKEIVINGDKEGNTIHDAHVVFVEDNLEYVGTVELSKVSASQTCFALVRGGTLTCNGKMKTVLKEDFTVTHSNNQEGQAKYDVMYKFGKIIFEEPVYAYGAKALQTLKKVAIPDINDVRTPSPEYVIKFIEQSYKIDTLKYSKKALLTVCPNSAGPNALLKQKECMPDSFYLGNQLVLKTDPITFIDNKGNSFSYDEGKITAIDKAYKDCFVKFRNNGKSELYFTNGEEYRGSCYIAHVGANGRPEHQNIKNGVSYEWGDHEIEMMHSVWDVDSLGKVEVCFLNGVFTDADGNEMVWENGFSQDQINMVKNAASINQARFEAARIKELKDKTLKTKQQLLAEGFNAQQVTQLIDNCDIYEGMSNKLVERALQLGGNVKSNNMVINEDIRFKHRVIKIYNMNTAEREFMQVVRFDKWLGVIDYVGPDFP